jgi:hypothetical protein
VGEQPQVLPVRPVRHPLPQHVVGDPERRRREQVVPVPVRRERTRLADQPVDHVPVGDPVLTAAPQARHPLHHLLRVPHLHVLGVQPDLDPLADQPAGHRVRVPPHVDCAPRIHPRLDAACRLEPTRRQRTQVLHLLGLLRTSIRVQLAEQIPEVVLVRLAAEEVPAGPEHQLLIERLFEPPVPLLHVPVLVAVPGLDRLPLQTVVPQQRLVPLGELRTRRAWWDSGGEPVGAVDGGHATEFRQRVLQSVGQRLERLGEADRPGLPVRVRQDEVVDQVVERLAVDGHPQVGHVGEVGGAQTAGRVDLGEEHLLGRPLGGPPRLDPPLEGAELPVREHTRMLPLELPEEGQRLQPRVEGQPLGDAGPDVGERVRVSPPRVRHPYLAGEPAEPAVLAGGLGIHPRPDGGEPGGRALRVQVPQPTDLLIGREHAEPSTTGVRSA